VTSPHALALSSGAYAVAVLTLAVTGNAPAACATLILGGGALGVAHIAVSRRPSP
jgi:hypothetical protein